MLYYLQWGSIRWLSLLSLRSPGIPGFRIYQNGQSVCIVQPFASWADSGAASFYGGKPFVVLRFCNVPLDDYDPYPQRGAEILKKHYGFTSEEDESKGDDQSSSDAVYEQWVSMETPNVRLDNEEPLDEAFAFHRCLQVLSDLLRAHNLVYHDHRVRPITTYDVGAVVFMGEFKQHGETVAWELVRPIYMHPHRYFRFQANRDIGDDSKQLVVAYNQLKDHPLPHDQRTPHADSRSPLGATAH